MDEPKSEIDWRAVQTMQLGISGFIVFLMVVIWFATGVGYFWPIWVWFGLSIPIAVQYAIRRAIQGPRQWRALSMHAALSCVAGAILTFIWVLTGFGFWLFWPLFGLGAALILHMLVTSWWRAMHPVRERELTERVDVLTRTRRGALDAQAAELRRIERDLHDGAQARLVALSMQLGRAEDRLEDHPEAAELVRNARDGGVQRDQGAARPRARHRAAGADRSRPAGRRRVARRALRAAGHGRRAADAPARHRSSSRRPTSSSPSR